jgi:Predicted transcriptional regulators
MSDYGRAVRILRAARNFNQAKLAKHLGLCESMVSRLEGGLRGVSAERLELVAKVFGCAPEVIISLASDTVPDAERCVAIVAALLKPAQAVEVPQDERGVG